MKSFFLPKVATGVALRKRGRPKGEVRLTAFQAALRLLKRRMARSEFGWGCDEARHATLDGADIFRAAMCQAVHEALWTVAHAGVEEEPLTASLMGGLTSCLSWYALLARLDQDETDEPRHCNVYWAHQPRHVERWRGADFGIARRLPSEDFLRITLFQAKMARAGVKTDLYRRLHEDKIEAANISLRTLLRLKRGSSLPPKDLHQIHKLYKTRNRGLSKISPNREACGNPEWVRYFFWFASKDGKGPLAAPSVRSVTSLLEEMSVKLCNRKDKDLQREDFKVDPQPRDLADRFDADFIVAASDRGCDDLLVDFASARELMGELAKIGIPDFFIGDEDGGDAGEDFWRDVFSLTNLTVTFKAGTRDMEAKPSSVPSLRPGGG